MLDADRARVTAAHPESSLAHEWGRIAGGPAVHGATRRLTLRRALATPWGVFTAKGGYFRFGRPPLGLFTGPVARRETGFYPLHAAGLRYFGHWLRDGLPAALLAREDEALYLPCPASWPHAAAYARAAGLTPAAGPVFFDELTLCEDVGQNASRRARVAEIHARLAASLPGGSGAPGVYVARGAAGGGRALVNEEALIAALKARGFAVTSADDPLEAIRAAAAGARITVAVEGSHWNHAFFAARQGALHITLNPSDRFNNVFADAVPCLGGRLATSVAVRHGAGYVADIDGVCALVDEELGRAGGQLYG